jgi:hypothetical protein
MSVLGKEHRRPQADHPGAHNHHVSHNVPPSRRPLILELGRGEDTFRDDEVVMEVPARVVRIGLSERVK